MRRKGKARAQPGPTDSAAAEPQQARAPCRGSKRISAAKSRRQKQRSHSSGSSAGVAVRQGVPDGYDAGVRGGRDGRHPAWPAGAHGPARGHADARPPRGPGDCAGGRRCPRCRAALALCSREPLRDHAMIEQARDHRQRSSAGMRGNRRAAAAGDPGDAHVGCRAAGRHGGGGIARDRLAAGVLRGRRLPRTPTGPRVGGPHACPAAARRPGAGSSTGSRTGNPEVEQAAVRRARAESARQMQVTSGRERPVHEAVRPEYARLREAGARKTGAARAIVEDPAYPRSGFRRSPPRRTPALGEGVGRQLVAGRAPYHRPPPSKRT